MNKSGSLYPMIKISIRIFIAILIIFLTMYTSQQGAANNESFIVDSTSDEIDVDPGNGFCMTTSGTCTLRAAIQETNALPGSDLITLPVGTYTFSIAGENENAAAQGDLDITDDLTIQGAGADTTIIDGNWLDRVFDLRPSSPSHSVYFSGISIIHGSPTMEGADGAPVGGGINIGQGMSVIIEDSIITNNVVENWSAGGVMNRGSLTLVRSTVGSNIAAGAGGLFNNHYAHMTLIESIVDSNQNGGLYNEMNGVLTVTQSTISHNTSTGSGGGIYNRGHLFIDNSTISNNAAVNGSGIYIDGRIEYTTRITNSTISNNTSASGYGIYVYYSNPEFENTIIANDDPQKNCYRADASIVSLGFNLDSGNSCNFNATTDLVLTNPLLGPLQNNGGTTNTHGLLEGSPAIDRNNNTDCPEFDQRGESRPMDGNGDGIAACDIGAYEVNATTPETSTPTPTSTSTQTKTPTNTPTPTTTPTLTPISSPTVTLTPTSHGPNQVLVSVVDSDNIPQAGLSVYAFNGTTYTGYNKVSDANGQAVFTLPQGSYRFRVDKNGTQFWSDTTNHCTIPGCSMVNVTVTVPVTVSVADTDGVAQAGLSVYAFNGTTYTGYNKVSDANGQAVFTLPQGSYRFRVDKNGTQFWSDTANHCTIPGCSMVNVTVTVPVTVSVADTDGVAQAGLSVYAFNGTTYTGYNKVSDANGQAVFTLPQGGYRFRVDKNGTQFWSDTTNHCTIPGCTTVNVAVTVPVTVSVADTDGVAQAGLSVYAFNGTTYTGYNKVSDVNGQAVFTLPQGRYRFRVDKNGTQFWSDTANHCTIPGCTTANVAVTVPVTVSVADTDKVAQAGLSVYAFNGATYTGYSKVTDTNGQAVFTLPQGGYRFRVDKNGTQFWSDSVNHCTIPGCTTVSITVTIPVTVSVLDTDGVLQAGLSVYAFNGTTYTGYSKVTDANGQAVFTLPQGGYRFRTDRNGTQFWSDSVNHCTIPGCVSINIMIPAT
jgi:CSLREA domain-containing protein